MSDLKACTVCFSTGTKLYNMNNGTLRYEYNLASGLHTQAGDSLPEFLCVLCSALVRRSHKFRDKCQRAHRVLQDMLHRNKEINKAQLQSFHGKEFGIMPPLSYLNLDRTHYEEVKIQWDHNRLMTTTEDIVPLVYYTTINNQDICEGGNKNNTNPECIVKIENEEVTCVHDKENLKEENFAEPLDVSIDDAADDYFDDDDDDDENRIVEQSEGNTETCKSDRVKSSQIEEEYASVYPISVKEAKAVLEVYKLFRSGKYKCTVCNKGYHNKERLNIHSRMHDKHTSGTYHCNLCNNYYKTNTLLQTHMNEKHMYKYVCRKCPEVSFDRISAQQHYLSTHQQKEKEKNSNLCESRPSWLSSRGGKRVKGVVAARPVKKNKKLPDDFLISSAIAQEEQYQLINDRKKTRNYIDSVFKCELCYRGFRESGTYEKHMKKHDSAYSGKFQCDMCKVCFRDLQKLSKHMKITHLFKYTCQMCSYCCFDRGQAHSHYKWHNNVTYSCPHCDKVFKNPSTRVTHVRMKHTSTHICILCGHSFISDKGLNNHKKIAHTPEERELCEAAVVNPTDPLYCADCGLHFLNDHAFVTHLGSSSKHASTNISSKPGHKLELASTSGKGNMKKQGRQKSSILNKGISLSSNCEVCNKVLVNDVQARKHYESEHPGTEYLKRYMCDVCGHVSRQHAHLLVHMRSHTKEKPYECPHCDRRFSMSSSRDRHLVVHTGEKRFECQHCHRRFTQSNTVKLHIQTVHHKIPYAPWAKKNRKNRKELEGTSAPARTIGANQPCGDTTHKLLLDTQGNYLNAYINHHDH